MDENSSAVDELKLSEASKKSDSKVSVYKVTLKVMSLDCDCFWGSSNKRKSMIDRGKTIICWILVESSVKSHEVSRKPSTKNRLPLRHLSIENKNKKKSRTDDGEGT
jgi:hypothetical protein